MQQHGISSRLKNIPRRRDYMKQNKNRFHTQNQNPHEVILISA